MNKHYVYFSMKFAWESHGSEKKKDSARYLADLWPKVKKRKHLSRVLDPKNFNFWISFRKKRDGQKFPLLWKCMVRIFFLWIIELLVSLLFDIFSFRTYTHFTFNII